MNQIQPAQDRSVAFHRQATIAKRLAERTPEQTLELQKQLAEDKGVPMLLEFETCSKSKGFERVFCGAKFSSAATQEQRRELLAVFRDMMTPAPYDVILGWLAEMSLKTKRKTASRVDEAVELQAYADDLASVPADILKAALNARYYDWWPSVGKILGHCDTHLSIRRAIITKLEYVIDQKDKHVPARLPERLGPDERARAADDIMRRCGFRR